MDNLELHDLQAQRTTALAAMQAAGRDMAAFNAASKAEATLAAQIRRLKRKHRNGADISLTLEDKAVFHRASERQEREYRIADRTDAEVTGHRLAFGGVARAVAKGVQS